LEADAGLAVVVARSDILNAGSSVLLRRTGFAAVLNSGIASKMSDLARARRSGIGAARLEGVNCAQARRRLT